jgi:hypothetical protein
MRPPRTTNRSAARTLPCSGTSCYEMIFTPHRASILPANAAGPAKPAAMLRNHPWASFTLKDQPGCCCAPAEDQDVADLAENDLGGEDLGEHQKGAD